MAHFLQLEKSLFIEVDAFEMQHALAVEPTIVI